MTPQQAKFNFLESVLAYMAKRLCRCWGSLDGVVTLDYPGSLLI